MRASLYMPTLTATQRNPAIRAFYERLRVAGKSHKVACHFAAELGQNPAKPITPPLLGTDDQGNHDPGASPVELNTEPGFADTWYDLKNKTFGHA